MSDDFLAPTERAPSRGATPVEVLEMAYDDHRADARAQQLADDMRFLFEGLRRSEFRKMGLKEVDLHSAEHRDRLLAKVAESNLFLVFEGEKPADDDRTFVYGNSKKNFSAAILITGVFPFDKSKKQEADIYLCKPDNSTRMQTAWSIDEIDPSLVATLSDLFAE